MACVVFPVDSEAPTGVPPVPDEEVAEAAPANPDVLVQFSGCSAWRSRCGRYAAYHPFRPVWTRSWATAGAAYWPPMIRTEPAP